MFRYDELCSCSLLIVLIVLIVLLLLQQLYKPSAEMLLYLYGVRSRATTLVREVDLITPQGSTPFPLGKVLYNYGVL
jgi:hypothetical protein